jgi:adenylate cyclase
LNFRFSEFEIDVARHELRCRGNLVSIEPQVFDLLVHLVRNRNRTVSKSELVDTVWKGRIVSEATLSSRVSAARQAIGDNGADQELIRTYYKRGFRFVVNVDETAAPCDSSTRNPVQNPAHTGDTLAAPALVVSDRPSIAVLPFQNMSGDPEQEYFSDGMTEDLITDLSKVSGLFVIARNSSFAYKGRSVNVQEIGRDLGVRFVLEGSVRKAGNRVRITAQLIDAGSGGHLWAERFDRDLTDIFSTQDEVVEKIVGMLAVTLTRGEEQRLRRHGTGNVEAYESWLRARELLTRGTRESVAQSRVMYRRAIEIDLNFARPHAGLALAAISEYVSGWAPDPAQALDEAERWARRAVELSDQEPVSHLALGAVLLWRRDHEGALAESRRMMALDPNFAQGYSATGLALMYAGRAAEALEPIAMAMRLDPLYPSMVLHFLAQANFSLGKYEIAAQQLVDRIARTPGTDASRMLLASCYGHLGRAEDARAAWVELLKVNTDFSLMQRARVLPYKDARDFQRIAEGLAKAGLP